MAGNTPDLSSRLNRWRQLHYRNAVDSLRELIDQPVATGLTVAVIGIALALPASLNILVQNGRALAGGWESVRDFSVYMVPGTEFENASALAGELRNDPIIKTVIVIPAEEALEDFRDSSGLGEVLDAVKAAGGAMIVTADHGNCETMVDPETGGPHTAHTTNLVPVILFGGPEGVTLRSGRLADLAPTLLELMQLPKPDEMTGDSLIVT